MKKNHPQLVWIELGMILFSPVDNVGKNGKTCLNTANSVDKLVDSVDIVMITHLNSSKDYKVFLVFL